MKLSPPNCTQVPNELFELMTRISHPTLLTLLVFIRDTYGFGGRGYTYTYDVTRATGLSEEEVEQAALELMYLHLIDRDGGDGSAFTIDVNGLKKIARDRDLRYAWPVEDREGPS